MGHNKIYYEDREGHPNERISPVIRSSSYFKTDGRRERQENNMDILKELKIDDWYKIFIIVGSAALIAGLTVQLTIDSTIVVVFSLAAISIGLGEWINHPIRTSIYPPGQILPTYTKIESYKRKPSLLGILFDIGGGVLCVVGFIKILY